MGGKKSFVDRAHGTHDVPFIMLVVIFATAYVYLVGECSFLAVMAQNCTCLSSSSISSHLTPRSLDRIFAVAFPSVLYQVAQLHDDISCIRFRSDLIKQQGIIEREFGRMKGIGDSLRAYNEDEETRKRLVFSPSNSSPSRTHVFIHFFLLPEQPRLPTFDEKVYDKLEYLW